MPLNESETALIFHQSVRDHPNDSVAVIGMKILIELLRQDQNCSTVQGLDAMLRTAINQMYGTDDADAALNSGCELLMRFITLTSMDQSNFQECRRVLVERAERFLQYVSQAREAIANHVCEFLSTPSVTCLVYHHSRVVAHSIRALHRAGRHVCCYAVGDDSSWEKMRQSLSSCMESDPARLQLHCIPEKAMSLYLGRVDCVLLGVEAFCQSGGVVNCVGTRNVAVLAKHFNKPVYALTEFFKFSRESPLSTEELPLNYLYRPSTLAAWRDKTREHEECAHLKERLWLAETPRVDYTEHELISLVIYDQGIIPPEVATVEIIKLYV